ncbi:carbohydrate-binding protein [Geothermobacter ehrlichii]|uniref:hypothetical protein n=1 Tax=Geothermobacter ehrlichii TaxID=213224 RepID=UPI0011E77383|nr:hypothetical protein [Geothermobacter ehrlichii]
MLRLSLLLLCLLLASGQALAAPPTQRDWLINLVDGLGWSFGLPDNPQDADYLAVVDGGRRLHIEAEEAIQPEDLVAVKNYRIYGDFSGEGWVSGIARPTTAHLRFLLPIGGRYEIRARLRLPGHRFTIGGQEFTADGGTGFTTVVVAQTELVAGENEIAVTLPANGSLDYLELQAPAYPPIAPPGGWRPDRPLRKADLAATVIKALQLENCLPQAGETVRIEAETASDTGDAEITRITHLGHPSGGAWLRARAGVTRVVLDFTPPAPGVYRLALRGTGKGTVRAELDGRYLTDFDFPPYLQARTWASLYLAGGKHRLEITLPPRGGIDALLLTPLSDRDEDYLRLSGLQTADPPEPADLDRTLELLNSFMLPR